MDMLIDTSDLPFGRDLDYESADEVEQLDALAAEAKAFVQNDSFARISKLTLAFGVVPILGLFLVRFENPRKPEDT